MEPQSLNVGGSKYHSTSIHCNGVHHSTIWDDPVQHRDESFVNNKGSNLYGRCRIYDMTDGCMYYFVEDSANEHLQHGLNAFLDHLRMYPSKSHPCTYHHKEHSNWVQAVVSQVSQVSPRMGGYVPDIIHFFSSATVIQPLATVAPSAVLAVNAARRWCISQIEFNCIDCHRGLQHKLSGVGDGYSYSTAYLCGLLLYQTLIHYPGN